MEFKEIIGAVAQFHDAFGIQNNTQPTAQLTAADVQLRYDLMKEENEEYLEAAQSGDLVEIADALGDQLYILCGTICVTVFSTKSRRCLKKSSAPT